MEQAGPGVYKRRRELVERIRILANAVCGMPYDAAMEKAREMNTELERGKAILEEFRDQGQRGKWNGGRAGR